MFWACLCVGQKILHAIGFALHIYVKGGVGVDGEHTCKHKHIRTYVKCLHYNSGRQSRSSTVSVLPVVISRSAIT